MTDYDILIWIDINRNHIWAYIFSQIDKKKFDDHIENMDVQYNLNFQQLVRLASLFTNRIMLIFSLLDDGVHISRPVEYPVKKEWIWKHYKKTGKLRSSFKK